MRASRQNILLRYGRFSGHVTIAFMKLYFIAATPPVFRLVRRIRRPQPRRSSCEVPPTSAAAPPPHRQPDRHPGSALGRTSRVYTRLGIPARSRRVFTSFRSFIFPNTPGTGHRRHRGFRRAPRHNGRNGSGIRHLWRVASQT